MQGGAALLDADEDSQLILSMLSRTQSSRSVSSQRSGELPSSLDRAPSLIRSASDSQAAWLPAAKKPRLGTGVSQQAEDTLLGRCGSFFAALDRSHSAGAPSAKSHAAKAAKTAVGLRRSSASTRSRGSLIKVGRGQAPAKGRRAFAGIAAALVNFPYPAMLLGVNARACDRGEQCRLSAAPAVTWEATLLSQVRAGAIVAKLLVGKQKRREACLRKALTRRSRHYYRGPRRSYSSADAAGDDFVLQRLRTKPSKVSRYNHGSERDRWWNDG